MRSGAIGADAAARAAPAAARSTVRRLRKVSADSLSMTHTSFDPGPGGSWLRPRLSHGSREVRHTVARNSEGSQRRAHMVDVYRRAQWLTVGLTGHRSPTRAETSLRMGDPKGVDAA